MSKKEFWDRQVVLECPECGKGYKNTAFMMFHFARVHGAKNHKEQLAMLEKAVDTWNKKYGVNSKETTG